MDNLEERIEGRLDKLGKSKSDLARHIGVSWNGLSKMIKRGTFKSDYMLKISKFLEVDINFFGMNLKEASDNNTLNEPPDNEIQTKVEMLNQIIATKDEVIRSKDELIATLKEKLHSK